MTKECNDIEARVALVILGGLVTIILIVFFFSYPQGEWQCVEWEKGTEIILGCIGEDDYHYRAEWCLAVLETGAIERGDYPAFKEIIYMPVCTKEILTRSIR